MKRFFIFVASTITLVSLGLSLRAARAAESGTLPPADLKVVLNGKTEAPVLRVAVHPQPATHLNLTAPLKLELTGLESEKTGPFGKTDFDEKNSEFLIHLKSSSSRSGGFKLTYSICDVGNKTCRRVVETRSF